ncbi:MAG TPA: hypothetical protein VK735_11800 [Pseudonocardia sp.]|uniref:hypothetical protein n=1 Tax=Pseudonocardia sp. TaxID=60912 RepID=UPI002CEC68F7|nr:hypothetical protein [Pseudonocardia sp.]HTF48124.1 hypothetical protein [Pseudonocardia sp.]
MFKKAGIVLAVSAAGLLVASPLAFAGDYGDDDGGHGHHSRDHDGGDDDDNGGDNGGDDDGGNSVHVQKGLINLQDVGVQAPIQACNNSLLSGTLGILSLGQRNSDSHDGKCGQSNSDD